MEELPRTFGRYELLELLAIGGMAQIYRAQLASAEGANKELVIKRVLPHLAQNREFLEMFVDEARITLPLTHGNIVQVFEFGQVGEDYFLAMEYVRGRNLETVLDRVRQTGSRMPVELCLFVASEVARGLDYAHRFRDPNDRPTGIIHRDVSPQNVLIGFQGEVKLTDFGIAKARSRIRQTAQGIIRGKACYLSPEQAECRDIDGRSDQFSLGVVLFEMLTDTRPFEGDTEVATLQRVREAKVSLPDPVRRDLGPELVGALLRSLARDPVQRFETCGAFQAVVQRALGERTPDFHPATLAEWMRGLFAADITRELVQRTTRERLLEQMARDGRLVPAGLSTGEILRMGTMDMRAGAGSTPQPLTPEAVPRRRRRWLALLAAMALVAVAAASWLAGPYLDRWLSADPSGTTDGGRDASDAQPDGRLGLASPDAGGPPDASQIAPADADTPADADPAPTAADERRPPHVRYGYLNLNANPWALVEIDGHRLPKETPLFKVRVTSGRHRLRFFNPELKIEKVETVRVRPNQTTTVSVRLGDP